MSPPLLAVRGLRREFGATVALADATFDIAAGERVAICGPSGAGKSTLLTLLGLLDTPTSGSYTIAGTTLARAPERRRVVVRRRHIGFVFQSFHLVTHLTATENVMLALEAKRQRRSQRRARARQELVRVGLEHRLDALPLTLSGGEQQRVAIARATVSQPTLLLCDEPTGNLDDTTADGVLTLLLETTGPESAVVIVTHSPGVAARCDRVLHVVDGVVTGAS